MRRDQFEPSAIPDPEYSNQWHLGTQFPGLSAEDAWKMGYTGWGVVISVVDDGLDFQHPDLAEAYAAEYSYDILSGKPEIVLEEGDTHGTPAAGLAVARFPVFELTIPIEATVFVASVSVRQLEWLVSD